MTDAPVIDPAEVTFPLRLLDMRDAAAFADGHAPGAVRVPIEDWVVAARTAHGSLDSADYWGQSLAALGLGAGLTAAIYDDGRMTEAARVWFILQHFGLPAVVLNGGWPAVADAGLTGAEASAEAPILRPGAGRVGLIDRAALRVTLGEQAILDTRTAAEHQGRDLKGNPRGGHLPGALLLPHADLLEGARLRSPSDLRWRLTAAGFTSGRPIVTHCDGGGRAALAALAAVVAGFAPVSVYYLSFSDWAADESCPVVTPT